MEINIEDIHVLEQEYANGVIVFWFVREYTHLNDNMEFLKDLKKNINEKFAGEQSTPQKYQELKYFIKGYVDNYVNQQNETYLAPPNKCGFGIYHCKEKIPDETLTDFYDNVLGPYHEKLIERVEKKLQKKQAEGKL